MTQPDESVANQFLLARHEILESFACLEAAVIVALARYTDKAPSDCLPLGQRLEALENVKPNPKLSKAAKIKLVELVDGAKLLVSVRNDVIHSAQHIINLGELSAAYRNSAQSIKRYPVARVLTLGQHETLAKEARNVAEQIRQLT